VFLLTISSLLGWRWDKMAGWGGVGDKITYRVSHSAAISYRRYVNAKRAARPGRCTRRSVGRPVDRRRSMRCRAARSGGRLIGVMNEQRARHRPHIHVRPADPRHRPRANYLTRRGCTDSPAAGRIYIGYFAPLGICPQTPAPTPSENYHRERIPVPLT